MIRPLPTIGSTLICLCLAVGSVSAAGPSPRDLKKLRLAHVDPPIEAPDLSLMDLERGLVSLRDLRGKGVLIYFWASW